MKTRKFLALITAAVLTVTTVGQTAGVLAAEFTDAEVLEQEVQAEETDQWEDTAISEENRDPSEEISEETDLEFFDGGEKAVQPELIGTDDAELFEKAESEADPFSAGEPEEAFADGDTEETVFAGTATADYRGIMISKEEFEHLKRTGEGPGEGWTEKQGVSFADFIKNFSGKTGYLLVAAENNQGYEDLVIPKGLTVVIACGAAINIRSITANGDIYIWENVYTPGTLELKEGAGSVTFKDSGIHGTLSGKGTNDTVTLAGGECYMDGIQGMENLIFTDRNHSLRLGSSKAEFYNIENRTDADSNEGDRSILLFKAGYDKNNLPVFHKSFDLGMSRIQNDDGTVTEEEAGVGIHYVKSFDVPEGEDFSFIDCGARNPAVKFDMASDAEILDIAGKMWYGGIDAGYSIDIDGTVVSDNDNQIFTGFRYQSCDRMTAEEAFSQDFIQEIPYECLGEAFRSNTLENMLRILEADQKSGTGQGYYSVRLSRSNKGTLTVPSSVTGVLYRAYEDYNEETDAYIYDPVQISSVDVPSGKAVRLFDMTGGTGTLKITGAGTAALLNCRMNQDVTAGNLILHETTVKSLTCDKLSSERTWFGVEKSLKFNKASLLSTDIIARAGASLNLGEINNEGTNEGDMAINLEVKDGKTASVAFTKAFNLGKTVWEEKAVDACLDVRYYDYAKAASMGACCAKDFYNMEFSPWDEEGKNINEILAGFSNKSASLMSFTAEATKSVEYMFTHMNIAYNGVNLAPMLEKANAVKVPLGQIYDDKDPVVKNTYLTVNSDANIQNISGATVSSIATQIYTGKALTPAVTVKLNGKTLKKGTDYVVSYKNNTKAGTASITVTGIRNYTGTITKTFKINYATPVLNKATAKAGSITVSWKAVKGAKTYCVYRKSGKSSWKAVKNVTGTSYKDTSVKAGTKYTYTVRVLSGSKAASGYKTSGISAVAYYATPKLTSAKAVSKGIQVKWSKVSGAASYRVYRKSGKGSWKALKNVKGTSFTDTTARKGTTYTYTVRVMKGSVVASAYNTKGVSAKR